MVFIYSFDFVSFDGISLDKKKALLKVWTFYQKQATALYNLFSDKRKGF